MEQEEKSLSATPSADDLKKQLDEAEKAKQQEFIDKYNALRKEYGYEIAPQFTLSLKKIQ